MADSILHSKLRLKCERRKNSNTKGGADFKKKNIRACKCSAKLRRAPLPEIHIHDVMSILGN